MFNLYNDCGRQRDHSAAYLLNQEKGAFYESNPEISRRKMAACTMDCPVHTGADANGSGAGERDGVFVMSPLSDAQAAGVVCWIFAASFAVAALFHLLRTLYLLVHCKAHGKPETLDEHYTSFILLLLCAGAFLDISRVGRLPLLPAAICIGGWFFIPLCVTLQKKLVSMKSWREYLEDVMGRFFGFLEGMRDVFLWLETIPARHGKKILLCFAVLYITMMVVGFHNDVGDRWWIMLVLPPVTLAFLHSLCNALHFCRMLLFFWFTHGMLLTLYVVKSFPTQAYADLDSFLAYGLFVVVLSLLWIVTAGVADDAVAKMSTNVVNTGTTILVILLNVLVGWGFNRLGEETLYRSALEQVQFYGNLILLPLIVSGYLAALLKEVQIYWYQRLEKQEEHGSNEEWLHRH